VRVVLDTNVLISGLLFRGGPPQRLLDAWRGGAFDLLLSDFVIDELVRVWHRLAPRVKQTPADMHDLLDLLHLRSEVVYLDEGMLAGTAAADLRDPDDVPVLATLLATGADWLVTGDGDLLALSDRYPILTPMAFVERFMP